MSSLMIREPSAFAHLPKTVFSIFPTIDSAQVDILHALSQCSYARPLTLIQV